MKRLFIFASAAVGALALGVVSIKAQSGAGSVMKEARVTQVVKDVKLLSGGEPRPATLSDTVRGDTAVRTGAESRAELTFGDLTIARLGANTIFSFNQGSRTVDLSNGAILLRVPKGSGGAKVQTAAVTAAITGTTVIVEYHPKSYAKYLVLEGSMRIYLKGTLGESVLMGPGQMMILNPNAKRLSEPVDFDLARLWKTSLFIQGFRPLQSEGLMAEVKQTQLDRKAAGELIDTNLVIFGRGTLVTLTDPQSLDVIDRATAASTLPTPTVPPVPVPTPTATIAPSPTPTIAPSPTPQPTPSKFGTPGVITSFVPYPIDNGTVIQTDPSITRAGVIDFGTIYRGSTQDGPFSAWAFGATSPFDTTSGIDTRIFPSMAVFKFAGLQLVGNPTVLTANGGVGNLGLVSVGPISSAPAGDTNFTLPNRGNLLIATQSGSIALSGINFSNLNSLTLYARGVGSNLTVSGGLTNLGEASFLAEGDVQTNSTGSVGNYVAFAGNDYLAGTGLLTVLIRIDITAQRDLNFASRQFAPQGPIPILVNGLLLNAGRAANLDVSVDNSIFNMVGGPGVVVNGGSVINVTGNPGVTTLSFLPSASFTAGAGGIQASGILFQHTTFPPPGFTAGGIAMTSGGAINVNGIIGGTLIQAAGPVNAAGVLNAQSVTAGSNVTAGDVQVLTLNAPGVLTATAAGIHPFLFAGPGAQHQFTIGSIVSPNGIDFSGDYYVSNGAASPQPGGKLSINATTVTLDGAGNFSGSSGAPANSAGSSGGQFTINTTGAITLNAPIQATTGANAAAVPFGGTGGTVSLTSTAGPVNVNSSILVSSNDPNGPAPLRRSAAGGTLSLNSGLTSGNAITLGAGAQLFSLLNGGAPGPGGQITISSAGGNIISNGATIQADRGTITIQHSAAASAGAAQITLDGGAISSETLLVSSRGDLSIGSTTPVNLSAITLSLLATNNVSWSGGTLNAAPLNSSGNVTVQSGNDILLTGPLTVSRLGGGATNGLDLTIIAGRNFQSASSVNLTTDGSLLTNGGNILFQSGGTMTIGAPTPATATFQTGPVTDNQANGSNITINAGGLITVSDLFASVAIGAGRTLATGGVITLTGTGSYTATLGDGGLNLQVLNSSPGIIGTGGNISLTLDGTLTTGNAGALNLVINNSNGGRIQTGGNITSSIGTGLTANSVNVLIDNRFKGFIGTGAGITFSSGGTFTTKGNSNFEILNSQSGTTGGTIGSDAFVKVTFANATIGADLNAFIDNSDGSIGGVGGTVTLQVNGKLAVSGRINVSGTLTSTGSITTGQLSATDVNAPGIDVGAGGITRFTFPNEITVNPLHTITTGALTSTGGINFNGPDMDTPPGFGPFNGGQLTINVPSLTFGPSAADNIQGPVTFNGGSSSTNPIPAGSGGIFTVNATGAVTVSSPIQATTGLQPDASESSGDGGTVNLNSTGGAITINSAVTVSSADIRGAAPAPPRRTSRSGGSINLKSDAPTGVAINVSSTGQLLSLLDAAAPGPGGKITILATGANSSISVTGDPGSAGKPPADSIRADRGSVDIRHMGANGSIGLTNPNISADIVKVGALGTNGTLTIGGGRINADTILKLYAVGSNGSVTFVSNVLLSGNSMKIIAGNSVTVNNNVTVSVGGGQPADVYVLDPNKANYSNLNGGNNSTNGMFIIDGTAGPSPTSGAVTHLGVAPPAFGPPGGP
jgi:hypothetical protein